MSGVSESSAEVQREAEVERAELVSTLDQLRENLKPANVVDEVMASAKVTTAELTDRIWTVARNNPIPAAIIGIGALMLVGAGKLVSRSGTAERKVPVDREPAAHPSSNVYETRPVDNPRSNPQRLSQAELSARLRVADVKAAAAAAQISDSAHRLRDQAAGNTTGLRRSLKTLPGDPTMAQHSRSRLPSGNSLTRLIEEQPLILAAVGVAVGAAIGAAIPTTETESRLMGDTNVQLRSRAQQLAASEYQHLKDTAGATLDDLKQTAVEHGLSSENIRGLVEDAGARVRDSALDVADHAADTAGLKT